MTVDWHQRFLQQSQWTKSLREYLLSEIYISTATKVLELGCGTGVITSDFYSSHPCQLLGIDILLPRLILATRYTPDIFYQQADALNLPYSENTIDIVFCHYFLLWVLHPEAILTEVFRVLKPGGIFLVFAEPDHAARIDTPEPLETLGSLQTRSLKDQGANITMGRSLPGLLSTTGFKDIRYGVAGFQSDPFGIPDWWNSEWEVLVDDLKAMLSANELTELRELDRSAWQNGSRVLWVPTFYGKCKKPDKGT